MARDVKELARNLNRIDEIVRDMPDREAVEILIKHRRKPGTGGMAWMINKLEIMNLLEEVHSNMMIVQYGIKLD